MKRVLSVLALGAVVCGLLAGCGSRQSETTVTQTPEATTTAPAQTQPVTSALDALASVWSLFAEDEMFWVMGGDYNDPVGNGPGAVDLSATDFLTASLLVPETALSGITEAASMMHAMNGNNFTCAVYKVSDVSAFAGTMEAVIRGHQWVCGMPEQLKILDLGGGYVLVAFGIADAMDPFFEHLATAHPQAVTLADGPVAE